MDAEKKGMSVGVWVAIILGAGFLAAVLGALCLFGFVTAVFLRSESTPPRMAPIAPPVETVPVAAPPAAATTPDEEIWPTENEATAAILKVEYAINASETNKSVWKVKDFRHEVKSVKFAKKTTQKQMHYGAPAVKVYPVKILYTQITDYEGKTTRVEAGVDGVWFLYRDSFGEWTGKFGNE